MGARGNSGVILSQIVRGAAEELASRPGELVDPVLVAAAFARAADAAYESVRDPAEGTMLTVFREMAHSIVARSSPTWTSQRLDRDATDERAGRAARRGARGRASATASRRSTRTPEQLEVLRESGVVDAGGYGLVLILAGVVAGLRGDADGAAGGRRTTPRRPTPAPTTRTAASATAPTSSSPGTGSTSRSFVPRLEELGDSVLVVGDEATLKVHVHTDEPEAAVALFEDAGEVTQLDVADMREQIAERDARGCRPGRCAGGRGRGCGPGAARRSSRSSARYVVDGGATLNPSTYELLAAIHEVPAEEVLVFPNSPNVIMAAERAAELSEKPARVVALHLAAGRRWSPWSSSTRRPRSTRTPSGSVDALGRDPRRRRSRRRPATTPRAASCSGDAVGFVGDEIVAWGGAGSTLARDDRAARRGGRDRHRDQRRGRADPARRARRPRSGRASSSSSTTAASRTTGGCSRRSDVSDGLPVLWQYSFSHYNEKARWALDFKGDPAPAALAAAGRPARRWRSRAATGTLPGPRPRRQADRRLHRDHRGAGGAGTRSRPSIRRIPTSAGGRSSSRTSSTSTPGTTCAGSASGRGATRTGPDALDFHDDRPDHGARGGRVQQRADVSVRLALCGDALRIRPRRLVERSKGDCWSALSTGSSRSAPAATTWSGRASPSPT